MKEKSHAMLPQEIRRIFLEFFESKKHKIVPSAPLVIKNDPTLMFTNAGMNQFKDWFLGNEPSSYSRIADTQKCLRVTGKHNDLEDVGHDTYHHTMFEMLGNWSFGDERNDGRPSGYFKKEAIEWAWELLTEIYKLDKNRLYVTVFEGDKSENLDFDQEAYDHWAKLIDPTRIINGSKKDNFWEMGDMGPCGPCSEIHVDLRNDDERNAQDGKALVNNDHPQVIEIWNLVFMEFNRLADGSLQPLPAKHVDTGMGFERLVRAINHKTSNYDTEVFQPLIRETESLTGQKYGTTEEKDIAHRVIADHIRTIGFAICDGQLPSNTGAGYVIRRILRRAVRYGYSSLGIKEPFLFRLVPVLSNQFLDVFQEMNAQKDFISKVIREEEQSFMRTLENGLKRINDIVSSLNGSKLVDGATAFELYDTYGFPIDLTSLILKEKGFEVDEKGFEVELDKQKKRSREAGATEASDWTVLREVDSSEFIGYDQLKAKVHITRYRQVKAKDKEQFHIVFDRTPFYAESGGQVGDTGYIQSEHEKIEIIDTRKENNLIIHIASRIPEAPDMTFQAFVNDSKRINTSRNHSATHLLHAALKYVLGGHVAQKGSLVNDRYLRFDFSHFAKVEDSELKKVQEIINRKIWEGIQLDERRGVPVAEAMASGATALFGEKYGDKVRVITFDPSFSVELCGGTHVHSTSEIGLCKIISESAVAAGVRRIEAVTGPAAFESLNDSETLLNSIKEELNNAKDPLKAVNVLLEENQKLRKQIDTMLNEKIGILRSELVNRATRMQEINFISSVIDLPSSDAVKNLAFSLRNELKDLVAVLGVVIEGKPQITVIIDEELVKSKGLHAGNIVKRLAAGIKGGGGGQPFYATAGGTDAGNLHQVISEANKVLFA